MLHTTEGNANFCAGTGDIKTGFLEKRIGENSGRQNLPESMKWQKRYFVLTETKGMLYYFKSADDPPNYRGVINVKDAKVSGLSHSPPCLESMYMIPLLLCTVLQCAAYH